MYIDETDFTVKAREIDPEVITNLPSDFPVYTITGDFSEYFDTWLTTCGFYAIVRNKNGVIKYRNMGQNLSISEFRKATNSSGKTRYLCANDATVSKGTLVIYDENLEVVDVTATADGHDFVYFDDDHIASFQEETINEYKKIDGIWQIVGQFKVGDYPKLKTDMYGIYESPETIDVHSNTLSIDYDNNFIFNMRNNDSFIKIKRTENDDGTVTIGSKTLDYDEAIIGRVGGKYNSGYLDSKRVIEEGFHFTDVPTTLKDRSTDERPIWQWYHAHDVTYWGMKTIGEKQYPTYTLFDNNMWTNNAPELAGNIYNYNDINPRNNYENNPTAVSSGAFEESKSDGGGSYDTHMVSRIVQLSIDWDNHLIKDYKVYIIPKKYSSTASGVQMFDEGVLLIAWANQGFIGLYDFNDEQTQTEDKIYTNGKELFTAKRPQYTPGFYRIHGYKK